MKMNRSNQNGNGHEIAFGPVPSRRLGRSLGINNIPPKVCTYACVYCQLGRTMKMQVERQRFFEPEQIVHAVKNKVEQCRQAGERIDYLTFVPDGEPTLDINLGAVIELLKPLGFRIAVITNASLIWRKDVRNELLLADWVSLKVDAIWDAIWRKIDRPHGTLQLAPLLDGLLDFAQSYRGGWVTETMLVAGINDGEDHLRALADFLASLQPATSYLAIPTRPPAEAWVQVPDEHILNRAYHVFAGKLSHVEYLMGYEGNAFACTGNVEDDLLSITSVHPMRIEAVREFVTNAEADWTIVDSLLAQRQLVKTEYRGVEFLMRKLPGRYR